MNIEYIQICSLDVFTLYKNNIIELIKLSSNDDAILGYTENTDLHKNYFLSIEQEIKNSCLEILIGLDQSEVILCCFLKRGQQDTNRHICDLQKGFIHPRYRGSGVLGMTMLEIADLCLGNGVELLTLDVRENTRAHKLWIMCGFKTFGILQDYSRYKNASYNGHFMAQSTKDLREKFLIS